MHERIRFVLNSRPEHGLVWFVFLNFCQTKPNRSELNRTKIKSIEGQTKADRTEIFGSVQFGSVLNQLGGPLLCHSYSSCKGKHYSDSCFICSIVCLPTPKRKQENEAIKTKRTFHPLCKTSPILPVHVKRNQFMPNL